MIPNDKNQCTFSRLGRNSSPVSLLTPINCLPPPIPVPHSCRGPGSLLGHKFSFHTPTSCPPSQADLSPVSDAHRLGAGPDFYQLSHVHHSQRTFETLQHATWPAPASSLQSPWLAFLSPTPLPKVAQGTEISGWVLPHPAKKMLQPPPPKSRTAKQQIHSFLQLNSKEGPAKTATNLSLEYCLCLLPGYQTLF